MMFRNKAAFTGIVVAALLGCGQLRAGLNLKEYLEKKKTRIEAEQAAQSMDAKLYENARTIGIGENLGRDRKSTALNYTIYGGWQLDAAGKRNLILHKIERAKGASGSLFGPGAPRNSFIISYRYPEPDEIYIQGSWIKVLEFDNTMIKFVVLEGRKAITHTENKETSKADD